MKSNWDMKEVMQAVGVLNSMARATLSIDGLEIQILHWGVTPPRYWRSRRHPNPCAVHKHPYFEVCHALLGEGVFKIGACDDFKSVRKGDTFWARPELHHCYGSSTNNVLGICFWAFTIQGILKGTGPKRSKGSTKRRKTREEDSVLLRFANAENTLIERDERTPKALNLLFTEALDARPSPETVRALIRYLILHLASDPTHHRDTPPSGTRKNRSSKYIEPGVRFLGRARQFIQDHAHRSLHLDEVARRMGFSARHLARMFREQSGEGFSAYLLRVRIEAASHLLLNESYSMKQIASKTGFGSVSAFSRAFKRRMGIPPGDYRRRSLGASE